MSSIASWACLLAWSWLPEKVAFAMLVVMTTAIAAIKTRRAESAIIASIISCPCCLFLGFIF